MPGQSPKIPQVPLSDWQDLLAAANAFRTVKPWTWMDDHNVFALIDDVEAPLFSSVLGSAGLVFGLTLNRGENGLRFLFESGHTFDQLSPDALFKPDALFMDWGAKSALAPEELAVLTALGHRPNARERNAWPYYRAHSPGWVPWHLNAAEVRTLAAGIRATLVCAELCRADPDFFARCELDDRLLPTVTMAATRAGNLSPAQVEWRQWRLLPPPVQVSPTLPASWTEFCRRPKHSSLVLEFDIFHTLAPIMEGDRPFFPRVALVADGNNGYIYGMDLAQPDRSWADLVTTAWSKALSSLGQRPSAIAISRPEWSEALRPLTDYLDIKLLEVDKLPFVEEARESMNQHLSR